MKTQIFYLLISSTCLFLLSCKKDVSAVSMNKVIAPGSSLTISRQQHISKSSLPFKGEYTDSFEMLQPPPMFIQKVYGIGNVTYFGNSTFVAIAHVNRSTQPPFAVTGTRTFTAANGDQLFTTFSGISTPVAPGVNKTQLVDVITGGTGRFSNASGSLNSSAVADLNNSIFTVSFDGQINF